MIPNAAEITRRRVTAFTVLRLIAATGLLVSTIPLAVLGAETASGWVSLDFDDWGPFVVGWAIPTGLALVFWALSPRIARLMIRVPRAAVCPKCGFTLEALLAPQCTECGCTLTQEFMTTSGERALDIREPDTILLRQITTVIIRLGAGAFVPVAGVVSFLFALQSLRNPEWGAWPTAWVWLVLMMLALGAVWFASAISTLFVPGRSRFGIDPEAVPRKETVPHKETGPHPETAPAVESSAHNTEHEA